MRKENIDKPTPRWQWLTRKKMTTKIIILVSLIAIFFGSTFIVVKKRTSSKLTNKTITTKADEEWMTIFVHGAFGTLMGLLNTFQVINDNVAGTAYKKIVTKMRKDDYFYKDQPILQRGLVKITPSFDLSVTNSRKHAVYPLTKAYESILQQVSPNKEKNHFYTFGWTGLMSQQRRRIESIRFYNALSEEITKLNKSGINPKVRIISHSHGGNLALNLAAVKILANNLDRLNNVKQIELLAKDIDEQESILWMLKEFKQLDKKVNNKTTKGQKLFDYLPEKKDLTINELIMFGTPIQPETEGFIFNKFFKKVYNFYSEEDSVQSIDWISTKKSFSNQRITLLDKMNNKNKESKTNEVFQAKIMVGRKLISDLPNKQKNKTPEIKSFWSKLLSGENPFSKQSKDPTHKELWFVNWQTDDTIAQLPTFIFTPLLLKTIENIGKTTHDIDLNINLTKKELKIYTYKHNQKKIENKNSVSRDLIETIKYHVQKWKPDDLSATTEFNIISKYSNEL